MQVGSWWPGCDADKEREDVGVLMCFLNAQITSVSGAHA